MQTVGDIIFKMTGMSQPRPRDHESAVKIGLILQNNMGIRIMRKDGIPYDVRFLSAREDFIEIVTECLRKVLDMPVTDLMKAGG